MLTSDVDIQAAITRDNAKSLLRDRGCCGLTVDSGDRVCILPIGHDGGVHDRVWTVTYVGPHYLVDNYLRSFHAFNGDDARWLAATLTKVDGLPRVLVSSDDDDDDE